MREKTYIIAEAGANHNRDFKTATQLIDVAVEAAADAIKFQTYSSDTLYAKNTPDFAGYQNVRELIKSIQLPRHWQRELKQYCDDKNIEFVSTPFDEQAVDELYALGVKRFKIAAFESGDPRFVRYVASTKLPLIFSAGVGANIKEIQQTLQWIFAVNHDADVTILHCNSSYPTPFMDINLRQIELIRQHIDQTIKVGLSDHTEGIFVPPLAIAFGAQCIEKHFTLSRSMSGPDHFFAIEPNELIEMVSNIRLAEVCATTKEGSCTTSECKFKTATRSVVCRTNIQAGTILTEENITTKRPLVEQAVPARYYFDVIGAVCNKDLESDAILSWNDIGKRCAWVLGTGESCNAYQRQIKEFLPHKRTLAFQKTFPYCVEKLGIWPKMWVWFDPASAMDGLQYLLNHVIPHDFEIILLHPITSTTSRQECLQHIGNSAITRSDNNWAEYIDLLQQVCKRVNIKIVPCISLKYMLANNVYREPLEHLYDADYRFALDYVVIGNEFSRQNWNVRENKLTMVVLPILEYLGYDQVFVLGFDGCGGRFYDSKNKAGVIDNFSAVTNWHKLAQNASMDISTVVDLPHSKLRKYIPYVPFEEAVLKPDAGHIRSKLKILHILYAGNYSSHVWGSAWFRWYRTAAAFHDHNDVENFYVMPYIKNDVPGLQYGSDSIQSINKYYFPEGWSSEKLHNRLVSISQFLEPDAILMGAAIAPPMKDKLKLVCHDNFYLHHHGLMSRDIIEKVVSPRRRKIARTWFNYKLYFGLGTMYSQFLTSFGWQDKFRNVGLAQIDYMLSLDMNGARRAIYRRFGLDETRPAILFVAGGTHGLIYREYEDYMNHMRFLYEYAVKNDCYVFVKTKDDFAWVDCRPPTAKLLDELKNMLVSGRLFLAPVGISMYDLFFAEAIVVQESSSAMFEALLANKNVIESNWVDKNDFFGLHLYPKIPHAGDIGELERWLDIFLNNIDYRSSSDFCKQRTEFLDIVSGIHDFEHNCSGACSKMLEIIVNDVMGK